MEEERWCGRRGALQILLQQAACACHSVPDTHVAIPTIFCCSIRFSSLFRKGFGPAPKLFWQGRRAIRTACCCPSLGMAAIGSYGSEAAERSECGVAKASNSGRSAVRRQRTGDPLPDAADPSTALESMAILCLQWRRYPARSAVIGSTREAQRAGT